jgi:hypothetical protein
MSETHKYEIKNIGLGDLTFFCGEMLLKLKKDDILIIKLNEFRLYYETDLSLKDIKKRIKRRTIK